MDSHSQRWLESFCHCTKPNDTYLLQTIVLWIYDLLKMRVEGVNFVLKAQLFRIAVSLVTFLIQVGIKHTEN